LHSAIAMLICLLPLLSAATVDPGAASIKADQAKSDQAKSDQAVENQSLRISDRDVKSATARPTAAGAAAAGTSDLTHVFVALLVVICVILVIRSAAGRLSSMPGGGRAGKLVTVLSRSMISPRQHVLVLQVGNRLLVVGDSAGRMSSLCEISDPDEIAMMVGQTRQARESNADRSAGSFFNLFRRANQPFNEPITAPFNETDALAQTPVEPEKQIDPPEAVSSDEVHGLLDKVRQLQKQFQSTSERIG
jgi:flagellar biogenesis protein FliO